MDYSLGFDISFKKYCILKIGYNIPKGVFKYRENLEDYANLSVYVVMNRWLANIFSLR